MIQKPMAVLMHQATTVHLNETAKPRRLSSLALQICDSSKTWSVMLRKICSGPALRHRLEIVIVVFVPQHVFVVQQPGALARRLVMLGDARRHRSRNQQQ